MRARMVLVTVLHLMLAGAVGVSRASAEVLILEPIKDNTIFSADDQRSNALGSLFTGTSNTGNTRRCLVAFDVAGAVPPGALITSAALTLRLDKGTPGSGLQNQILHRLLKDWGEGASNSGQGDGAPATTGDATWAYTFFPDETWGDPGGDFEVVETASRLVDVVEGPYVWGPTPEMIQDVQAWLDDPSSNFGWILRGNDVDLGTARKYYQREEADSALRPTLAIGFELLPTGACCMAPQCVEDSAAGCAESGGAYFGDGVLCDEVECTAGACCLPDGGCQSVIDADDCTTAGGNFQGFGVDCATVDCPQNGACCFNDGICTNTESGDCAVQAGTFLGVGTNCTAEPCFGACCLSDGSCADLSEAGCAAGGGVFQALSSACASSDCPQPGPCCFDDGSCTEVLETECAAQGGSFQGAASSCMEVACVPPESPTGACCMDTGVCTIQTAENCSNELAGSYEGDETTCEGVDCPQLVGTCCVQGDCQLTTPQVCQSSGGQFAGGTDCGATDCSRGACCVGDGSETADCIRMTTAQCAAANGLLFGAGTTCADVICPPSGACCLADGSCTPAAQSVCLAELGGEYDGELGCDEVNCPPPAGACCSPDGCFVQPESECGGQADAGFEQFLGPGTTCGGEFPCCLPDGSCLIRAAACCTEVGGTVVDDAADCSTLECPQPTGACCLPQGLCASITLSACAQQGGSYQGHGSACADVSCGGCCLPVDLAEHLELPECTPLALGECASFNGVFLGSGTSCTPASCRPAGACCLPDGSCSLLTTSICTGLGGRFLGDGSVCAPVGRCQSLDDPAQPSPPDRDEDGVADEQDNCVDAPNPNQADSDADGIGDLCDLERNSGGCLPTGLSPLAILLVMLHMRWTQRCSAGQSRRQCTRARMVPP